MFTILHLRQREEDQGRVMVDSDSLPADEGASSPAVPL